VAGKDKEKRGAKVNVKNGEREKEDINPEGGEETKGKCGGTTT